MSFPSSIKITLLTKIKDVTSESVIMIPLSKFSLTVDNFGLENICDQNNLVFNSKLSY